MRYRELAERQIIPFLGGVELQKLRAAAVEEWHRVLLTSGRKDGGGLSPMTIKHAHRLLGKVLREAMRFGLVTANAASLQPPPRAEREETVVLTTSQIRHVVDKLAHRLVYPKVIIALFTGLRRGEVLGLRWGAIDFDRKLISVREALEETDQIRFKSPKSMAGKRDVPMPDIVVDVLRNHRKRELEQRLALGMGKMTADALVFSRLGGAPQSPISVTKEWRKAADSIGLTEVSFHALRHTFASMLIDSGIDVVKISKRLGHSNPTITLQTYAHQFAKREDKSAEAINAVVAELLKE
jgi:integrase